jgi:hypothetical protein
MTNLKKLMEKEILIHLTGDGFVSTVRYAGLFRKSATWQTRTCEVASREEPVFTQADADRNQEGQAEAPFPHWRPSLRRAP